MISRHTEERGKAGGIMQQTLSGKPRPGRTTHGAMIASGKAIHNGGRIAGGAPAIVNPTIASVFAPTVYRALIGARPGGLIDKRQQQNPESTTFGHPFPGTGYYSISSQQILPGLGSWNGFVTPHKNMPLIMPHERGKFFRKKVIPAVKTVFGANQSGVKADTAFKRRPLIMQGHPKVQTARPTELVSREKRPPSFLSFNRLVADPNNSQYGDLGRWGMLKRSASEAIDDSPYATNPRI